METKEQFTIGQVALATGVPAKTLRYYEQVGLLPTPNRSPSQYRLYSHLDLRRVDLIRRARALDMSLAEVKELVQWAATESCDSFQDRFLTAVRQRRAEVGERIAELEALRQDLVHLEAHLASASSEGPHEGHAMLACTPETCTYLGREADISVSERR